MILAKETGGTSISGNVTPGLKWLYENGYLYNCKVILDFGSGKYSRNTNWLREKGFNVYAYDPYHGWECNGFEPGNISKIFPWDNMPFDLIFSSYVLNVLTLELEDSVLDNIRNTTNAFHIVRNDIKTLIQRKLEKKDESILRQITELVGKKDRYIEREIDLLARNGVKTSRGFQRKVDLESKEFTLIKKTPSYKIYFQKIGEKE